MNETQYTVHSSFTGPAGSQVVWIRVSESFFSAPVGGTDHVVIGFGSSVFCRLHFLFDRPFDTRYLFGPNVHGIAVPPPARHPILWYAWYEYALPRVFRRIKPDLFVSPDGYASLRSTVKTLTVIHDINFEHFPKDLPFFNRTYYQIGRAHV